MQKFYRVTLTAEERRDLQALVSNGKAAARKLTRSRVLLLADQAEGGPAMRDLEIAKALGCGLATIARCRRKFVEEGLEESLNPKPTTRTYERRLDGKMEAHLVAMACGAPPEGRARWTLRLLADRLVGLGEIDSVSHETIRQTLKKMTLSLG